MSKIQSKSTVTLNSLYDLLQSYGYTMEAEVIDGVRKAKNERNFLKKATSSSIWGAAGSIADQAFASPESYQENQARTEFHNLMLQFGEAVREAEGAPVGIQSWIKQFRFMETEKILALRLEFLEDDLNTS